MNGIFLRILKQSQRRGIKWFSLRAVKSPFLVLQTAVQRLGIWLASELIIQTALLGSNLIVLPTSLLRLLAHFNNCFTCKRLSRHKGRVYPKMKIQSSYLLIPIMMEIQVKLGCPPNISGASRQKQCCRFFSNSYSRWGFDLFTNDWNKNIKWLL